MKKIVVERDGWEAALAAVQREPIGAASEIDDVVREIVSTVQAKGDEALLAYGRRFDSPLVNSLEVTDKEWQAAEQEVSPSLHSALARAEASIRAFHMAQVRTSWMRHEGDRVVGQLLRAVDTVGVYVPGGRAAYPSSVLMCAVPARVAGVREIIVCTPARGDGSVHPAVLCAARLAGVRRVFKIGGAQAVAAMAYGTATVPRVDKIVGPGNLYVCAAKRMLWGVTDMDMLAGPSEVCIVADESADARFVAADLLTQAEHDPDCAAFLLTPSYRLADDVLSEIGRQLAELPRKDIAERALAGQSACVVTGTTEEAIELANACAPEHLALMVEDPFALLGTVRNAGAVMMGRSTPQTVGDYLAGPSHTLPTGGTARFWSPLNVDSFVKKTSFMSYSQEALMAVADDLQLLAGTEGFEGHAAAVRIRLESEPEAKGDGV
jgi:histidinol dehydrogenase